MNLKIWKDFTVSLDKQIYVQEKNKKMDHSLLNYTELE